MHLQANASTARTLNLISVWKKHGREDGYLASPFLRARCSTARSSSSTVFARMSVTAARQNLGHQDHPAHRHHRPGGRRPVVLRKPGWLRLVHGGTRCTIGAADSRDDGLLQVVDKLPSLDPFLMRERLKKDGFDPDRCYFDLTDADATRMFSFLRKELSPLIGMSFDDMDVRLSDKTPNSPPKSWRTPATPNWTLCVRAWGCPSQISKRASSAGRVLSITNGP